LTLVALDVVFFVPAELAVPVSTVPGFMSRQSLPASLSHRAAPAAGTVGIKASAIAIPRAKPVVPDADMIASSLDCRS
jgi:hypothetical protein